MALSDQAARVTSSHLMNQQLTQVGIRASGNNSSMRVPANPSGLT